MLKSADTILSISQRTQQLTAWDPGDYAPGVVPLFGAQFDGADYPILYDKLRGELLAVLRSDYFQLSEDASYLDRQLVLDQGARGRVGYQVRAQGDFYTYTTEVDGRTLDVFCRNDRPGHAHIMRDPVSTNVNGHIFCGQSWMSNGATSLQAFSGDPESEVVLAPRRSNVAVEERNGPVHAGSAISIGGTLDGISGYSATDKTGIGVATLIAVQRWRRRLALSERPSLFIPSAYPGSSWTTGGGGGLGPGGSSWANMETIAEFANDELEAAYGLTARYKAIHWVQGGSAAYGAYATDYDATMADLADMETAFDALGYNGIGSAPFFIGQPSVSDTHTTMSRNKQAQIDFCRGNDRFNLTTPFYAWPYGDVIHGDGRSSTRVGEIHGLAVVTVNDLDTVWNPFWRLDAPIRISGNTLIIPLEVPRLEMFRLCPVVFDTETLPDAGDYGIQVRRAGVPLDITAREAVPCRVRAVALSAITLSGTQTIDGVACVAGDRVLVTAQTVPDTDARLANGVYVVAAGAWARAADFNTWEKHICATVTVEEGAEADKSFTCTAAPGGVLGTDVILWYNDAMRPVPRYLEVTLSVAPASGDEVSCAWYSGTGGAFQRSAMWSNIKVEGPPGVMDGTACDLWLPHFVEILP